MIDVDDVSAIMDAVDFDAMAEYSCSLPTGPKIGKRWKCCHPFFDDGQPKTWWLGEAVPDSEGRADWIGVKWRRILLPEATEVNRNGRVRQP